MIDRHHLLECILWPNGDGTFRKIVNTEKRLDELGIYKDYKLTILIEHGIHSSMHWNFKKGTEYGLEGENNPMFRMFGEKNPMYGRSGEKNPMYGVTGEKHPAWKGDSATIQTKYRRALKDFRNNLISKETFQIYREAWNESKRARRKNQRLLNSSPMD